MTKYIYNPPFKRTTTINTLCVVGVCTCIMIKMATEKVFKSMGITDIDVQAATESNPMGDRYKEPDIIMVEGIRIDELQEKYPKTIMIMVEDLAKVDKIKDEVVKKLTDAGWLQIVDE